MSLKSTVTSSSSRSTSPRASFSATRCGTYEDNVAAAACLATTAACSCFMSSTALAAPEPAPAAIFVNRSVIRRSTASWVVPSRSAICS